MSPIDAAEHDGALLRGLPQAAEEDAGMLHPALEEAAGRGPTADHLLHHRLTLDALSEGSVRRSSSLGRRLRRFGISIDTSVDGVDGTLRPDPLASSSSSLLQAPGPSYYALSPRSVATCYPSTVNSQPLTPNDDGGRVLLDRSLDLSSSWSQVGRPRQVSPCSLEAVYAGLEHVGTAPRQPMMSMSIGSIPEDGLDHTVSLDDSCRLELPKGYTQPPFPPSPPTPPVLPMPMPSRYRLPSMGDPPSNPASPSSCRKETVASALRCGGSGDASPQQARSTRSSLGVDVSDRFHFAWGATLQDGEGQTASVRPERQFSQATVERTLCELSQGILPAGPRVCVLGCALDNASSAPDLQAFTRSLAEGILGHLSGDIVVLTSGEAGVEELLATELGVEFPDLFHLRPEGKPSGFGVGNDVCAGTSPYECSAVLGQVGHVYICIGSDNKTLQHAIAACRNGAVVLPFPRLAEATACTEELPPRIHRRPDFASADQWSRMVAGSGNPENAAAAAVDILQAFLKATLPEGGQDHAARSKADSSKAESCDKGHFRLPVDGSTRKFTDERRSSGAVSRSSSWQSANSGRTPASRVTVPPLTGMPAQAPHTGGTGSVTPGGCGAELERIERRLQSVEEENARLRESIREATSAREKSDDLDENRVFREQLREATRAKEKTDDLERRCESLEQERFGLRAALDRLEDKMRQSAEAAVAAKINCQEIAASAFPTLLRAVAATRERHGVEAIADREAEADDTDRRSSEATPAEAEEAKLNTPRRLAAVRELAMKRLADFQFSETCALVSSHSLLGIQAMEDSAVLSPVRPYSRPLLASRTARGNRYLADDLASLPSAREPSQQASFSSELRLEERGLYRRSCSTGALGSASSEPGVAVAAQGRSEWLSDSPVYRSKHVGNAFGASPDRRASRYSMLRICENLPRNLYVGSPHRASYPSAMMSSAAAAMSDASSNSGRPWTGMSSLTKRDGPAATPRSWASAPHHTLPSDARARDAFGFGNIGATDDASFFSPPSGRRHRGPVVGGLSPMGI
eukprot:TRINITY_DN101849_c0_g1_i1.p1 TRINITY_DN101849_c0_g1~~TRINITY_DN101849_c0_g1_i1.p1  ORF type:complete len:1039 (-),score=185.80 TRINITY_DN101849_c0_g1_i1:301-3417(-)